MDFAALLALVVMVAAVLSLMAGDVIGYFVNEWRLMRRKTWAPPRDTSHPDCLATTKKLAQAKATMRARGIPLLLEGRKPYRPVVTMEAKPEKSDKVIRFKKGPR